MKKIYYFILATRPKTLVISLSLWLVGISLSYCYLHSLDFLLNSVVLFSILNLHIAVNYFNDVLDSKRGKDTSHRLGPKRMVNLKLITASQMIKAAIFVLFLAAISGLYLIHLGGLFIVGIGTLALVMTYFYSAPPIQLADRGLSEFFVFLYFGVLAILGIFHLNYANLAGPVLSYSSVFEWKFMPLHMTPPALVAGAQLGLLSISALVVNYIRDYEEDRITGKKTWVVRLGLKWGLVEWAICVLSAHLLGIYWLYANKMWAGLLPLLSFALYLYFFLQMIKEKPSKKYNSYLAGTSVAQLIFSIGLSLGFLI